MHATGIVAEYNPFHNGHLYHVQQTKKITAQPVIAVMSGNFMQRGEPAILNKWQRAALAVYGGVDLVLELPCAFTLRSAQYFANGAVQLLNSTGCVNTLSCGTEHPKHDFAASASFATSAEAQARLHTLIKGGSSYASAWEKILGNKYTFNSPNDILALEYTKALQNTNIAPLYIKRKDAGYNSTTIAALASATAIRHALKQSDNSWQQAVPAKTAKVLLNATYDETLLWQLIKYRLRILTPKQIALRCECSEGLENILKTAANAYTLLEAVKLCTRKRYTASRIRRLFSQLLFDSNVNQWQQTAPAYIRVLAFNDNGRALLKEMKQTAKLPIITKLGKNWQNKSSKSFGEQMQIDITASDIWSLLQYEKKLGQAGTDYLFSPVYIK